MRHHARRSWIARGLMLVAFVPLVSHAGPRTLVCDYRQVASPEGLESVAQGFVLNFIVDTEAQKSYVIGNNGTEQVHLISSGEGVTFVEVTATGNVMTTTMDPKGHSVHSRNSVILGELVPSQYYGTCEFR